MGAGHGKRKREGVQPPYWRHGDGSRCVSSGRTACVLLRHANGRSGTPDIGDAVKIWYSDKRKRRSYLGEGRVLRWLFPARIGGTRCEMTGELLFDFLDKSPLPIVEITKSSRRSAQPITRVVPDCPDCGERLVRIPETDAFWCVGCVSAHSGATWTATRTRGATG